MGVVALVSGGLDSTLMSILAHEEGLQLWPLFIDYGQRAAKVEWKTCREVFRKHKLPKPQRINLAGFGRLVPSGLTDADLDVIADAFLPGRNLLFLLVGASYATTVGANSVAIGLLDETQRFFEDQSRDFVTEAEALLKRATAADVSVRAPLMAFTKSDVVALAKRHGVESTYSCHAGTARPCGRCLACRELTNAREARRGR